MPDLLELGGVTAGYGRTVVLEDLGFSLKQGSALAILGRNGVGKSTLMRTIVGHATLHGGRIRFTDEDVSALPPWKRARIGIGYVPQEREIFPSLSVIENIMVAFRLKPEATGTPWTLDRILDLFPALADRRGNFGNQLSGGEQQMLSIARALALQPRLLLLDEPFEGLAPTIVDKLVDVFERLRHAGLSLILAEQHARLALGMTDEALALVRGRIVVHRPSRALIDDPAVLEEALTVQGGRHQGPTYA
jgi:branched-chain amino acid transport system ATP-binding protein